MGLNIILTVVKINYEILMFNVEIQFTRKSNISNTNPILINTNPVCTEYAVITILFHIKK